MWVNLIFKMTHSVEQHILDSPTEVDLRDRLRAFRTTFEAAAGEDDLRRAADEFAALVTIYRERVSQTARAQSQDLYRILATLNEALLLLAAGSTRTVGRLKQLEVSLERATSLNDMAALKSKLADILVLVREDVQEERSESQRERNAVEQQVRQLRSGAPWLRLDVPGRNEAIAMIERLSQSERPPFFVVVFVLHRIREIVRRYGDAAARDLVSELVHRRITFPDREPAPFRWSSEAVLVFVRWEDGPEHLNALIEPQIENPFEHRLLLGARVALLRVGLHWVVLPVGGQPATLVDAIDRFVGGHG